MNIVLYGFADETALRLAGRHGFTLCRTLDRLHDGHCLIASPGFPDDAARRTFLDRMLRDADRIDAVVAAVAGEDFGAVRYCAPPGAFHAADAEDPDTELERIVRSKLGLLCAHEGIGPRIEP